jgi:hypothetical protein
MSRDTGKHVQWIMKSGISRIPGSYHLIHATCMAQSGGMKMLSMEVMELLKHAHSYVSICILEVYVMHLLSWMRHGVA